MAIRILRSATTATPVSLLEGQLAYSENSSNLFIGTTGATVTKVGGNADVLKLAGMEDGAQVNTVDTVNGYTGTVVLALTDLSNYATDFSTQLGLNSIDAMSDVDTTTVPPVLDQFLKWDGTNFIPAAVPGGVSSFDQLDDTPATKVIDNYIKVDGTGTNLVYTADIDDGTF